MRAAHCRSWHRYPRTLFSKSRVGGGLVVSDTFVGLDRLFSPGVIPTAKNAKEFEELIRFYIDNPDKAAEKKHQQRLEVLKSILILAESKGSLGLLGEKMKPKKPKIK